MRCYRWMALTGLMLLTMMTPVGAEPLTETEGSAAAQVVEEGAGAVTPADADAAVVADDVASASESAAAGEEVAADADVVAENTMEETIPPVVEPPVAEPPVVEPPVVEPPVVEPPVVEPPVVEPPVVEPPPAPEVLPPPVPEVDPKVVERARIKELSFAFLKHECLPLSQVEEGGFFDFLSTSTSPVVDTCIADLDFFVRRNWQDPLVGEALMLQAKLFQAKGSAAAEAVALGKVAYLISEPVLRDEATGRLRDLGREKLKRERGNLQVLAEGGRGEGEVSRYARLLADLASFEDQDFIPLLRRECDDFLWRYSGSAEAEMVWEVREALSLRERDYESAAYGLRKMATLYPESRLRPARLLKLGGVYESDLKVEGEAVATYELIFTTYPEASEALPAYQRAAALCNGKMEQYEKGINLLNKIVELYPNTDAARQALQDQAQVFAEKVRNYFAAIKADQRLADMFSDGVAVTALLDGATLARKFLEDYDLYIELLERLVREYPQRDEAPQALYDIAETYEDDLKQGSKAIETYRRVIQAYPQHRLAEKAASRIEKLSRP